MLDVSWEILVMVMLDFDNLGVKGTLSEILILESRSRNKSDQC